MPDVRWWGPTSRYAATTSAAADSPTCGRPGTRACAQPPTRVRKSRKSSRKPEWPHSTASSGAVGGRLVGEIDRHVGSACVQVVAVQRIRRQLDGLASLGKPRCASTQCTTECEEKNRDRPAPTLQHDQILATPKRVGG